MTVNSRELRQRGFEANRLLRWAVIPALVYAAVMVLGLALWPTAPGIFASGATVVGRWLSALNGLFTIGVALFIMRRVPDNACGPLLLLWGVGVLGWSQPIDWGIPPISTLMSLLYQWYFFGVAFSALIVLLYAFPTGRIVPVRFRLPLFVGVLAVMGLAVLTLTVFVPSEVYGVGLAPNPIYSPPIAAYTDQLVTVLLAVPLILMLGAVVSLAWRYRHATHREQQQVKFLIFGFAVLVAQAMLVVLVRGVRIIDQSDPRLIYSIINYMAWQALPAVILAVTIARYKLWDIDLVIRRTVSYAILSGLLALIYFGSIVILQRLLTPLTGNSTPATVLSTLLIAALFLPLRRRVQDLIDRRFYRRKYDAAKVLAGFAATARDETDLDRLTAELVRVIQETMEPESVSVWLRLASDERRVTSEEADGR